MLSREIQFKIQRIAYWG
ncbi:hypothetical protein Goarm_011045 [Gossypium armourianum]|uniref:Uncharacterized protein n=1 Tax=Gossypium armourianum TaxID=34283 RepID=A0A7J9IVJ6_9ROSI|nr:hypothetical protein [Gossypium armourianum]